MEPFKNISEHPIEFRLTPKEINILLARPESKWVLDALAEQGMQILQVIDLYRLVYFPS